MDGTEQGYRELGRSYNLIADATKRLPHADHIKKCTETRQLNSLTVS